ncbi:MAG: hypothetical protein WCY11_12230 [Novosphingobium sp.]
MGLFNTRDARAASKTRKSEPNSASDMSIIRIDHAANIKARAKTYHGPDEGDIVCPALLRQSALLERRRGHEGELDTLDTEHAILEARIARKASAPASYHAATSEPQNDQPEDIPGLIEQLRTAARGLYKARLMAWLALLLALLITMVEIILLSEVLGFGMPDIAGEQSVSTGLLALAFLSVVAGSYFALERAGERITSLLDRVGVAAVLIYLLGAGTALGLKGSGLIGSFDTDASLDNAGWDSTDASLIGQTISSTVDLIGSFGLAVALAMITVLSLIAIHYLLRIGIKQAGIYLAARSAASDAQTLQADMTRIATGQMRAAREIEHIDAELTTLPRDVAVEINSIAAPFLAQAQERLAQMRIVETARPAGHDREAFAALVATFQEQIAVARLQAAIDRALHPFTLH